MFQTNKDMLCEIFNDILVDFFKSEPEIYQSLKQYIYVMVFFVVNDNNELLLYHFIGLHEYPNNESIIHFYDELSKDNDFKLDNDIMSVIKHYIFNIKDINL